MLPDDDDSLPALPSLLPPSGPDGGAQAYSQQPFASPLYTSTSSASASYSTTTAAGVSFDNNAYGGSNSDGSFNSGPSSASSNNARKDDGNSNKSNSSNSNSGNSGSTNGNGKGTRSLSFGDSPNLSSQPAPLSSYGRNNGRENASAGTSGSSSTNNNNINNTSGSGNIASPGMMENTPLPMPPPLQQRSSSGGGNSSHHHHSSSNSNSNAKLYAEELARQVAMAEAKGAEMLAVEASQCLLTLAVQVGGTATVVNQPPWVLPSGCLSYYFSFSRFFIKVEHPGDAKSQRNKALTSSSAKQKKGHSKSGATSPAAAALPTGRQEALASTLLSFALDVRDAAEGQRFQPLVLEDQRNLGILTSG